MSEVLDVMTRLERARAVLSGSLAAGVAAGLTARQMGELLGLKATTVRVLLIEWGVPA